VRKFLAKRQFYNSKMFRLGFPIAIVIIVLGYGAASVYGANVFTTSPKRTLGLYNPADYGLTYENVEFESKAKDELTLRGWWIPQKKASRVLILVHVKNGDRTFPLELSKPLWDKGYSLLLFDMRGHGQSDGTHYSYGQYEQLDIVGAVNFIKAKGFKPASIGIAGWSMGAASAIMAMSQTADIQAGVSDSSYGDLGRVAGQRLGLLKIFYPGMVLSSQLLMNTDIEQIKPELAIKKLGQRHLILIHGDQDSTVPVSEIYHLKQAGGNNVVDTWVLPGVEHAGAYHSQKAEYLSRITTFFDKELVNS